MTKGCLFIRDDDVWTLNQKFLFFFEQARRRSLPIVYAVIPGKLEPETARFLCQAKKETPHLLDLVQHGWIHQNYSKDTAKKYEFGPVRSLNEQRADIQQGQDKMTKAFGKYGTNAFVPPYHGYDQRTLKILEDAGFQVFSNGNFSLPFKGRFINLPAHLSFSRYDQGRKNIHQARDLLGDLVKNAGTHRLSGIVTHHMDFSTSRKQKELMLFFDYMKALKEKQGWKLKLFSDVIR